MCNAIDSVLRREAISDSPTLLESLKCRVVSMEFRIMLLFLLLLLLCEKQNGAVGRARLLARVVVRPKKTTKEVTNLRHEQVTSGDRKGLKGSIQNPRSTTNTSAPDCGSSR